MASAKKKDIPPKVRLGKPAKKTRNPKAIKQRQVTVWVDADFEVKEGTAAQGWKKFEQEGGADSQRFVSVLLGAPFYWGVRPFGYSKKLRITVEEVE